MRGKYYNDIRLLLWLLFILILLFFFGSIIYLLITSHTAPIELKILDDERDLINLVDQFARSVTRQDWTGATELFVPGSTVDFHRAFTFLSDYPPLSSVHDLPMETVLVGSWGQQMAVFAGGLSSNHLLIGNCNVSISTDLTEASLDCISIYSYTLAYSMSLFTNNYPTQFVVFQPSFSAIRSSSSNGGQWLFNDALALVNATSTLLNSIETGSAPPGAVITKKRQKRDLSTDWSTLLSQIDTLILGGQIDTAKAVCKTLQYLNLASTFDPYGNDTAFACNTITRIPVVFDSAVTCSALSGGINASTCFPDGTGAIETINSMDPVPITHDFTITGGIGIIIQGDIHGITVHNAGIFVLELEAPFPFYWTKFFMVGMPPEVALHLNDTPANTVWAGPTSGPDAQPTFRPLVLADIPLINLMTHVSGVLGLSNGGTNNGGPFAGNRIIVSNLGGTQLVEASVLSEGFFLVGDGMGGLIPGTIEAGDGINVTLNSGVFTITHLDTQTVVQVDLSVPTDIFQVTSMPILDNGTLTFVTLPQAAHAVWIGPLSGSPAIPSFRVLDESDMPVISLTGSKVSGVLPVSRGGTNNDGSTWTGQKVIMSNTGGTTLTEGTVTGEQGVTVTLGPGPSLVISGTGGTCTNQTIDQSCLDISTLTCPGGPLAANCIQSALTLLALTVTGPSSLGTSTTCAAPLSAPCYDISQQSCPGGYLDSNCINPDLTLNSLTVDTITANDIFLLNGTVMATGVSTFDIVNATFVNASSIVLRGPMTCTPEDQISQGCYDISGISCTSPISSDCFPINITVADMSVTNELEVNNLVCLGAPLGPDCIPPRIRSINGIFPSAAPVLGFTLNAGTGISITPALNGLTISNTGVTSVGLSLPASLFSITIPTVTTTGTLTAVLQSQAANTVFAAPDAMSGVPSFRSLVFDDLPSPGINSLYYIDGAGNLGAASLSLDLIVPASEFSVLGAPITNPTGSFVLVKQPQANHAVWIGPTTGGPTPPTFRTLGLSDLSPLGLTNGQVLTGVTGGDPVGKTLVAGMNMIITEMGGSFVFDSTAIAAISSIGMVVPSYLSVSPATLTTSGTFTISSNTQSANRFLAGPTSGGAAVPTFRAMTYADLPPLSNGQLYIGSTGMSPVPSQLTAGSLITITPGPGTSTVSSTALGSITLNMPTAVFDVMSTSGMNTQTLSVTFDTQAPNTVFAGPASGGAATPTFRPLASADLPAAVLLTYAEASSSTPILAFSTNSYTIVTSMTLTPAAGTYRCSFSTTVVPTTGSSSFDIAIHVNAVIIAHSRRVVGGAGSNFNLQSSAVVSTPGGQPIDVRWQKTAGTGTADMLERSLYCLRIT